MNSKENNNLFTRSEQLKNITKKNRENFKGVPKHAPINMNTSGIRRSPRIANMKRKQLDLSLNHVGFIQVNQVSEEEGELMIYKDRNEDNFQNGECVHYRSVVSSLSQLDAPEPMHQCPCTKQLNFLMNQSHSMMLLLKELVNICMIL